MKINEDHELNVRSIQDLADFKIQLVIATRVSYNKMLLLLSVTLMCCVILGKPLFLSLSFFICKAGEFPSSFFF